jgi:hypothetical protein
MKTINISEETHKALRAYCMKTGTKLRTIADKALAAWLRKAAR